VTVRYTLKLISGKQYQPHYRKRVTTTTTSTNSSAIMSQVQRPDIPDSQYNDLVRFITQKVAEESHDVEGLYHRRLSDLYLEAYHDNIRLEDEEYLREQKRFITKFLRYLLQVRGLA